MFQALLGPIVDVHLVEPADKVPEGVTVEIKHFLTIPRDPEVMEYMEGNGHLHDIVKVDMKNGNPEIKRVGIAQPGLTETNMFSTNGFQGQDFCYVLATDGSYKCMHSSPKIITITQKREMCPHKDGSLSLHCYITCPTKVVTEEEDRKFAKDEFEENMGNLDIKTDLKMKLVLEKNSNTYEIFASSDKMFLGVDPMRISHDLMCQYNGAIKLGPIKEEFGCCEISHCTNVRKIYVKAKAREIHARNDDPIGWPREDVVHLKCILDQHDLSDDLRKTHIESKPRKLPEWDEEEMRLVSNILIPTYIILHNIKR